MPNTQVTAVDLAIDQVDPSDREQLESFLDLIEEYYQEAWPQDASEANWRDRYRARILDRAEQKHRLWLWCARLDGDIVALATFFLTGAETDRNGVVEELYVRPVYRNRHVGRSLMESVKKTLREAGAQKLRASVQYDELGNIKFFESYGFRIDRLNIVLDLADQ